MWCGAACIHYIAQDDDLRSPQAIPGRCDIPGSFSSDVTSRTLCQLARLQVVEVVEAEPNSLNRRRREDTGVRQHGLMHMCLHVASVTIELRLDRFRAPTVSGRTN